jgi:superfamily I DNA and/or RNA helicase
MNIPDYKRPGSRWHGISCEPFISKNSHAIWVNVDGNEEKEGTSYKNPKELNAVKTVIRALTSAEGFQDYINAQTKLEDKEIGIITFYSAQKRELKRMEQNGAFDINNDYRIDVVDRFQGMERNIVIVSTVRSNKYNGIGFAKEIERINVAFSRARTLLIVIGNRDLFFAKYNYQQAINAMESIDIKQIEQLVHYGKRRN